MKRYFPLIFLALGFNSLFAQAFFGSIEFINTTEKDTTANFYWVKDEMVKLDHMNKKGKGVEGSFLFNLKATTCISSISLLEKEVGAQTRQDAGYSLSKRSTTRAVKCDLHFLHFHSDFFPEP
jgi:hypothetical protein